MKAIVVGSAASLLKKKAGNIIDTFDYVIRPVTCLLASGYEEYTGQKTDMFWVTYQYLIRISLIKSPADLLCVFNSNDEYKEFYVHCKTVPCKFIENKLYYDRFLEIHKKTIKNVSYFSCNTMCQVNAELGFRHPHTKYQENKQRVSGTSGINVLHYVVNFMNFDSVFTTGFDFYQSGFYWDSNVNNVSKRPFPYKEMMYYNKLLKEKKIYEL